MRRFRQWLAETQDHMTESPDGDWSIYTEALAAIEEAVKEATKSNRGCIGYLLDLEKQIAALTESRDAWEWQWRLMEAAEKKAEEQIATLQEETSRLYAVTVEQSRQIAALNDALSGRDNVIERLKGYLVNKKTDIAEKVEYIAALTAENMRLFEEGIAIMHDQGAENVLLKEENKRQAEEIAFLRRMRGEEPTRGEEK